MVQRSSRCNVIGDQDLAHGRRHAGVPRKKSCMELPGIHVVRFFDQAPTLLWRQTNCGEKSKNSFPQLWSNFIINTRNAHFSPRFPVLYYTRYDVRRIICLDADWLMNILIFVFISCRQNSFLIVFLSRSDYVLTVINSLYVLLAVAGCFPCRCSYIIPGT